MSGSRRAGKRVSSGGCREKETKCHPVGAGPRGFEGCIGQGKTATIVIGKLMIEILGSIKKPGIWHADAGKKLNPKTSSGKNCRNFWKAMAKLFWNSPPQPRRCPPGR